jgi:2-hydroxychromene-2-carboxylate isomerase
MNPIDFYFDFISPYAYIASTHIVEMAHAHGRTLTWKPFRLGVAVVKVMGLPPVMQTPLKSDYVWHDVRRLARILKLPFSGVDFDPQPLPPARAMLGAPAGLAGAFARAMLHAQWAEGRNLGDTDVILDVAERVGIAASAIRKALEDPATREAVNTATREAIERGVFGSPTCVVGGELFWGVDRLWLLDHYLKSGEKYAPMVPTPDAGLHCIGAYLQKVAL